MYNLGIVFHLNFSYFMNCKTLNVMNSYHGIEFWVAAFLCFVFLAQKS